MQRIGEAVISKYKKDEGYLIDGEINIKDLPRNKYKRFIWLLFEYPHSSICARIIAIISVFIITVSIVLFCVETLPGIKAKRVQELGYLADTTSIIPMATTPPTSSTTFFGSFTSTIAPTSLLIKDEFFLIETICIIWFSIELLMRFFSAPNKLFFVKQIGNIIDLFSILPYFMQASETSARFSILRIIRLVRVFRIFKLARHFKGLQILAHTLKYKIVMCFRIFYMINKDVSILNKKVLIE